MRIHDIAGGAVGAGIGLYALIQGAKMPPDHIMKIGPSFFPSLVAAVLIGFSALLALQGALSRKPGGFERVDFRSFGIWRALLSLGAAAAYTALLRPVGFLPMTVLFILALMLLLGARGPIGLVLVPLAATAGVWLVFEQVLLITLPVGLLGLLGF